MEDSDKRWKIKKCGVSHDCWCRTIWTVGKDSEEVVGPGSINKDFANYVVKLHNDSINVKK